MSTYPEKLVLSLLKYTKIEKNYLVLDPFAGSGTTLKVINDLNQLMFNKYQAKGIMIEFNSEYVEIIRKRTGISNIKIERYPYIEYSFKIFKEIPTIDLDNFPTLNIIDTINIAKTKDEFYSLIKTILTEDFRNSFNKRNLLFIGLTKFSIEDIYNISLINNKGWIIRSQLIVAYGNSWYPIYMLVHDNKKYKYYFNYKRLSLNHKNNNLKKYSKNFIGYKVINNLSKNKNEGKIIEILKRYKNNLPKYVKVNWNDGTITKEIVVDDSDEIAKNIQFIKKIGFTSVKEYEELIPLNNIIDVKNEVLIGKNWASKVNYNGKFKEIERKNWGASPGARSSIEEEYFSVQRLYPVVQEVTADYLNYIRKKNKLSKKAFTELFPESYKHTIGHWLRKDFGGSVPIPDDWHKLTTIFEIDQEMTNYVCKVALKLQTVRNTKHKIPDDLISLDMINKLIFLNME